jgi:hypothetical protein
MVVYDSRVPVGAAKAVYLSGVAAEVSGAGIAATAAAYNERSLAKGVRRSVSTRSGRPVGSASIARP